MILVTGRIVARPETVEALIALSLEHVERSRSEPGCLSHSVRRDVENPLHLVFFEQWRDLDALRAHFALESSQSFVREASALAAESPTLEIYAAERIEAGSGL